MKEDKGSFTVEAVILMPFLILLCTLSVYFAIYTYDRAMMVQDVNSVVAVLRERKSVSTLKKESQVIFREIENEHPYLSMQNIEIEAKKEGFSNVITIKGDFIIPFWSEYSRKMEFSKEMYFVRPVQVMYETYEIRKKMEEGK